MQAGKWLLITISLILGAGGAVVGLNVAVDLYGLYHPTQGSKLALYGDARVAKYLLNLRYVPENFNALLVGSSVTANWNLTPIERLRVYNDSLNGMNIVEGKTLVDSALSRPGIAVVFLLVHPALTAGHEFPTVKLSPELKLSTLGSLHLLEAYKNVLKVWLGRAPLMFDYAGTQDFGTYPNEMNADMKRMWNPATDFHIDPIAFDAYRDVVAELRARKVQIIFVVPPAFEGILDQKRTAFDKYVSLIRTRMSAGDEWIDFTTAEYADFRGNRSNFGDGIHFLPSSAKQVVSYLNDAVNTRIADGRIRLPARQ